jgi:hypothetical protein
VGFIERYFGISPDGGDGPFEVMLLVLLFAVVGTTGVGLALILGNAPRKQGK